MPVLFPCPDDSGSRTLGFGRHDITLDIIHLAQSSRHYLARVPRAGVVFIPPLIHCHLLVLTTQSPWTYAVASRGRLRLILTSLVVGGLLIIPAAVRMGTHKYVTLPHLILAGILLLTAAVLSHSWCHPSILGKMDGWCTLTLFVIDLGANAYASL